MSNERIMVVEDEWTISNLIQKCLRGLGYTISSVEASGEDAIRKAGEDKPDLVLMDIVLHDNMDGIEAADRIQSRFNIPVIYITAYDNKEFLERAKVTEPFGYIIKPFQERELHTNIEIALYKHKAEEKTKELVQQLRDSLSKVKLLSGLIPICSSCKNIRDDKGYWEQIELFIRDNSEADFTHSICPDCIKTLYPEISSKKTVK